MGYLRDWVQDREDIASGVDLADHVADFINEYNAVRPTSPSTTNDPSTPT